MDYDALEKRLREPPFGTETSERNLMMAAADAIADLRARNDALVENLNEHAVLIVELLTMPKVNIGFAGDIHIRRARRIIDGNNDAKARGEANYKAYCAASPDHDHEGTIDGLKLVATMIDTYAADALPANEHGQIHFARAMLESAAGEIKAYLARAIADLRARNDALVKVIARSTEGWENAVELGLIPPQHRNTATILADEGRAALAANREG